jgi:glycopeptide antibiotics resistance protein
MAVKNYFSIFFTNEPWKLDGEERKIHILLNVVLGIPILYLLSYIFANLMKLHYLPFFFALCFFFNCMDFLCILLGSTGQ